MNNTKKGFTLVELLVVIAILAILATVSVVGYTSFINSADESAAVSEAKSVKSLVESALYTSDYVQLANGLYVQKTTTGYEVVTATTGTDPKVHDATADWAEITGGTLTDDDAGNLVYTNHGYSVNLKTLVATKN